jgi:hypothetical protein
MKILTTSSEIDSLRSSLPSDIANEIVSVQPMDGDLFAALYNESKTERELKDEGYEPVSGIGLMWVKKMKENK